MLQRTKQFTFSLLLAALFNFLVFATLTGAETKHETLSFTPDRHTLNPTTIDARPIAARQTITHQINDVIGALYDPTTKELIVIGQMLDEDLPIMDYDYLQEHLLVALRSVHKNVYPSYVGEPLGPAVTIDPIPGNPAADHEVKFFGYITDTHYGYVFFEADRLLKTYALGKDNLYPDMPFTSTVPGYMSYFDRRIALTGTSEVSVRWWFTPSLNLRVDPAQTQTIVFSNTQVILNREVTGNNIMPEDIQAADDFVSHFNENYDRFAEEQRARGNDTLYELPQLFKLYGIAYWSWAESNAALNLSGVNNGWLDHYPIPTFITPLTTPVVSRSDAGFIIYGGVGTDPPKDIRSDLFAQNLGIQTLIDRPSAAMLAWSVNHVPPGPNPTVRSQTGGYVAMAFRLSLDLVVNGSFEEPTTGAPWIQSSGGNFELINSSVPHWGDYSAYLGGYPNANDAIYQQMTVPLTATNPRVSYYWVVFSDEPLAMLNVSSSTNNVSNLPFFITRNPTDTQVILQPGQRRQTNPPSPVVQSESNETNSTARDLLSLQILDPNNNVLETLQTISNEDIRQSWQSDSFPLDAYKGQTIRLRFQATNDNNGFDTAFFVDDVSLDLILPCDPVTNLQLSRQPPGDLFTGDAISFTIDADGSTPFAYAWTLDGQSVGETGNVFEHTFDASGQFTVGVTVANVCSEDEVTMVVDIQQIPVGRPNLRQSSKQANLESVESGDIVTYTLHLQNTNPVTAMAVLTDPIPTYTAYISGSAHASDGNPVMLIGDELRWAGRIISGTPILIEFAAEVQPAPVDTLIINQAELDDGAGMVITLTAVSTYNLSLSSHNIYLPVVMK